MTEPLKYGIKLTNPCKRVDIAWLNEKPVTLTLEHFYDPAVSLQIGAETARIARADLVAAAALLAPEKPKKN